MQKSNGKNMKLGGLSGRGGELNSEINMTPMVDVMLVLLIIFIVTIPVMKNSVEVNLPQASSKVNPIKEDVIQLKIDQDGRFIIGGEYFDSQSLRQKMFDLSEKNPQSLIHIYGDKKVPYEFIAIAMAAANKAGIQKIGFITQSDGKK